MGLQLYVAEPPVAVAFFVVAEPFAGLVQDCYDYEPDEVDAGQADAEVRRGEEEGAVGGGDLVDGIASGEEDDDRDSLNQVPVEDVIEEGDGAVNFKEFALNVFGAAEDEGCDAEGEAEVQEGAGVFGDVEKGDDGQGGGLLDGPGGGVAIDVECAEDYEKTEEAEAGV